MTLQTAAAIFCIYGTIITLTRLILWPLFFEDDFPWPLNRLLDYISKKL